MRIDKYSTTKVFNNSTANAVLFEVNKWMEENNILAISINTIYEKYQGGNVGAGLWTIIVTYNIQETLNKSL